MKKIMLLGAGLLLTFASLSGANPTLKNITQEIGDSIPDSAITGGNWSDAYIGQLFEIPPHSGLGISAGFSPLPLKEFKNVLSTYGMNLGMPDDFFLPTYSIEGRIGGLFFPFDLGARIGIIPKTDFNQLNYEYFVAGVDLRIPILKGNLLLPKLMAGISYSYAEGEIGYSRGSNSLNVGFETNVLELKTQISKEFFFLTPYLGMTICWDWTETESDLEILAIPSSYEYNRNGIFGSRIYGGVAFDILILKLDLGASYNFISKNWGANAGLRIQL